MFWNNRLTVVAAAVAAGIIVFKTGTLWSEAKEVAEEIQTLRTARPWTAVAAAVRSARHYVGSNDDVPLRQDVCDREPCLILIRGSASCFTCADAITRWLEQRPRHEGLRALVVDTRVSGPPCPECETASAPPVVRLFVRDPEQFVLETGIQVAPFALVLDRDGTVIAVVKGGPPSTSLIEQALRRVRGMGRSPSMWPLVESLPGTEPLLEERVRQR